MPSASRRRAANTFIPRRCSGEAADTRSPGWSKTRLAAGSPPGATYTLACSLSHQDGSPSSWARARASSRTMPWGSKTASMSRVDRRASWASAAERHARPGRPGVRPGPQQHVPTPIPAGGGFVRKQCHAFGHRLVPVFLEKLGNQPPADLVIRGVGQMASQVSRGHRPVALVGTHDIYLPGESMARLTTTPRRCPRTRPDRAVVLMETRPVARGTRNLAQCAVPSAGADLLGEGQEVLVSG